ncbi:hypothetical protein GCM10027570_22330 [Streptomonospora sediminis]
MVDFLVGVAGSLAATALVVAAGWLLSSRARRWAVAALAGAAGLGVLRVYRRQQSANAELAAELARADWLRAMVGRGNELTRDTFLPLWSGTGRPLRSIGILLPDSAPGRDTWLVRRETEIRAGDPGFRAGLLGEQVRLNARYLAEAASGKENCEIRHYDLPNHFRVIMTDNTAFITLYQSGEHGRNSPCIVARRPGQVYDFAHRVFASAWDSARGAEPVCRIPAVPPH